MLLSCLSGVCWNQLKSFTLLAMCLHLEVPHCLPAAESQCLSAKMWGPSIEGSQWVLSHLEGPNAWVFHWVLALPHIPSLPPGRMLAWVWVSLGAAGRGLAWVWVSALGLSFGSHWCQQAGCWCGFGSTVGLKAVTRRAAGLNCGEKWSCWFIRL